MSLGLISRLDLVLLFAGALLLSARASFTQFETPPTPGQPIPGTQGVSPFAGSVPAKSVPGVIAISLQHAIDRGWKKLTVARVIGLAPGQEFELTDKSPDRPFEGITVDHALKRAYASRSDYLAAMTDTVEVLQSQEAVASVHEQYISSLHNYNFAKISLVRAMGIAGTAVKGYFKEK